MLQMTVAYYKELVNGINFLKKDKYIGSIPNGQAWKEPQPKPEVP